ncbi:MAG: hypothetical protein V3U31_05930 [Dehalococcoidia bacterium]
MKGLILLLAVAAALLYFVPVSVAYEAREAYEAQVEREVDYRVTESSESTGIDLSKGAVANVYVEIENTDTVPGTFSVDFKFTTLDGTFTDSDRVSILPGDRKRAKGQADIAVGQDWKSSYEVTPSTEMVTETRYRTVTKEKKIKLYKWLLGERQ